MAELQADGVFEEAEGNIRQQLMAAAQLARSAVQARQDATQQATRRDLEEARQLQARPPVNAWGARFAVPCLVGFGAAVRASASQPSARAPRSSGGDGAN